MARSRWFGVLVGGLVLGIASARSPRAAELPGFTELATAYTAEVRPLIARYCLDCHSTEAREGELDLEVLTDLSRVRQAPETWLQVAGMLDTGEMPPDDAPQPTVEERARLRSWIERYLNAEGEAQAGDPGPVGLRRLNNAEYTYTIQDLTGVPLEPAREFPVDGAAGEGFTNAAGALAMSPALLGKYFDAAKQVAAHLVLLPDGARFSRGTTRRDWTDEIVGQIKEFYARFADAEGRLPLAAYLRALLDERTALATKNRTAEQVAQERGLNARYLAELQSWLEAEHAPGLASQLAAPWRRDESVDADAWAAEIARWQQALARFQNVGHMKPWVVTVDPLVTEQELRLKLEPGQGDTAVSVYLAAGEAGDGPLGDQVVLRNPRLVTPGRPEIPLCEVRERVRQLAARRARLFGSAAACLRALAQVGSGAAEREKLNAAAATHGVEPGSLATWAEYLGWTTAARPRLAYLTGTIPSAAGYDFVQGWGTHETPLVLANRSAQAVRVPGNMPPGAVAVHPSPSLAVIVGWLSPLSGIYRVEGRVTHAHPECGNGVTWALQLRRGATRQNLVTGVAHGGTPVVLPPVEHLAVEVGDLLALVIGPRDGNHACDLTEVELVLTHAADATQRWSLAEDLAPNILDGNPHGDRAGRTNVWHLATEGLAGGEHLAAIPAGSVLARWQATAETAERDRLADELERLLTTAPPADPNHPDAQLFRQLTSLGGPLLAEPRGSAGPTSADAAAVETSTPVADEAAAADWGLAPERFGGSAKGLTVASHDLVLAAPEVIELHLPADLVAGSELVATAALAAHPAATTGSGSVQVAVTRERPGELKALRHDTPVVVAADGSARRRILGEFAEFRRRFPLALCYPRIVPVDEVITLTLFHREDEPLVRLMLDDDQGRRLDRLWDELRFVSQDARVTVDAFAQLLEYASQDSDPRLFEPFRETIMARAAALEARLLASEPRQLEAVIAWAERAVRRPLSTAERDELNQFYARLRAESLAHDEALRLVLARVLVSPAFLYRLEAAPTGTEPGPVNGYELASRLSYFLWSSLPDEELLRLAASGELQQPDVLTGQARRMLADPKIRRLANEFACQWLHLYDFATLDEKSERHFPTFRAIQADMHEEVVRFFSDWFARDGATWELLAADHTFVSAALAEHYGWDFPPGDATWRRVDGLLARGRGGILGFAATLAKQSGASRTSPILRGTWISEVLLGDKLPRPPQGVPQLPEDEADTSGLTVRELVERHSSDPRCAGCHARVDPLGFALEGFDAIGRLRERDLAERPLNLRASLPTGHAIEGLAGLRNYLRTVRWADVETQFCRKLLGYALGRGLQLSDRPLVAEMRTRLAEREGRISAAIEAIVVSRQFRELRGRDAAVAQAVPVGP